MKLDKIPKQGTTVTRKAFWDSVSDAVVSLQKKAGRNVSVDEFQGYGTIINVPDTRQGTGSGPPAVCCDRDCDEISTCDVTLSIDADFHDAICGTGTRSDSFTWHFTRINRDDTFACDFSTPEFKIYFDTEVGGCCNIVCENTASHCSTGIFPHDWGKVGDICANGDFRFPTFTSDFDDECGNGTLDLGGGEQIGVVSARFKSGGSGCDDAPCAAFGSTTGFIPIATDIPISTCDVSALIGTYTLSHLQSYPEADITVTVEMVFA